MRPIYRLAWVAVLVNSLNAVSGEILFSSGGGQTTL
jgi:hypothetical protein